MAFAEKKKTFLKHRTHPQFIEMYRNTCDIYIQSNGNITGGDNVTVHDISACPMTVNISAVKNWLV